MGQPTTTPDCGGRHGVEIREGWVTSICNSCGTRVDLAMALRDSIEATRSEAAADALRAARPVAEALDALRGRIAMEVRDRTALLDERSANLRKALAAMVRDSHEHSNQNGCPDGPLDEGENGDPTCQGCRAYVEAFAALEAVP
jgi:hypothetical protein